MISVPAALKTGPFTIAEASEAGVTRGRLRGSSYRPLGELLMPPCLVRLKLAAEEVS